MTVSIRQLHPHFFGEVSGVDLRKPLTPQEAADIEAGMDKYAVLLFRDQDITDDQQLAFARNFGERENARGGTVTKKEDYRLTSGLNDVSNLGKDGKPLPRDHRTHLFNLGNCLWHSDSSFRPIPAKFSLLSARVVNPKGGNTEFADMRAAYDALDDETKAEIEDMICEHSLMYSRGSLGFLDYTEEEKQMFKPVLQRLVRTHPVHGRKSLYLSSHAGGIVGMTVPEARLLLRDLTEHATQREFVHVHKWTLHDLVMWDNRQTMHRVRRYDQSQPRDMRRATVAGTDADRRAAGGGVGQDRRPAKAAIHNASTMRMPTMRTPVLRWDDGLWPRLRRDDEMDATRAPLRSTACPDRSRSCAAPAGIFPRHRRRTPDPDRRRNAASHCPGFRFRAVPAPQPA